VLLELLASNRIAASLEAPERNALRALEALLEKQITAPFRANYREILNRRAIDRYGL
jgi:hypothetical protein